MILYKLRRKANKNWIFLYRMTPKQQRFCEEYMKDLNGKQAAIRTGYAPASAEVQASRLLSDAKVALRISELKAELSQKTGITVEYVINNLKEVGERCLQKKPVMRFDYVDKEMVQAKDEEGRDIWEFDSAGANKAFELLGKHVGAFETDNLQKKPVITVLIDE